jgi:hypothetical protein
MAAVVQRLVIRLLPSSRPHCERSSSTANASSRYSLTPSHEPLRLGACPGGLTSYCSCTILRRSGEEMDHRWRWRT